MNRKPIILLLALLLAAPLCGSAKKPKAKEINKALTEFATAFVAKDMAAVKGCLSEDFSISTASLQGAENFLDPVMKAGGVVTGIDLVSVVSHDDNGMLLDVIFRGSANPNGNTSRMKLDSGYKIVFADYLDRLFGGYSRYNKSKLVATIPFELEGRSIVIPLKFNNSDRVCRFLFDTGANNMAIRASLADSLGIKASSAQNALIVGGSMQLQMSSGNTVHLTDDFALTDQTMSFFPKVRHGLDGLIGLNICKKYITKVDFDRQEISLYTFGDYEYEGDGQTVAVKVPSILLLPVELDLVGKGAVKGDFVFDTGANFYLIAFSQFVGEHKLLEQGWQPQFRGVTTSMGLETPNFTGTIEKMSIAPDISYNNVMVTLQEPVAAQAQGGSHPAGSVGVQLLGDFNFTIDMLRKEVHLVWR